MVRDYLNTTIGKNMVNNITAHLQVHNNQIAVEECIRRFRLHFPNTPIYLHGDNGYNFSEFETKFNLKYTHSNLNVSPKGLGDTNWYVYLERILLTCKTFPNEWLLFLEEDVNTLHNDITFPTADSGGIKGHQFHDKFCSTILQKYPNVSPLDIKYNMCGGSIVKMDAMVKSIESTLKDGYTTEYLNNLDNRIIRHGDVLISALLHLNGYTYSEWEQLSETASNVFRTNAIFDHQWKEFYNETDYQKYLDYTNKL
jgi:hypothetical protein